MSGGKWDSTASARRRGKSSRVSPTVSFRQSGYCIPYPVTASTPEPEGGARCVSSARRDLREGSGATRFPTATIGVRVVDCHLQVQCGPHPRWVAARPRSSSSIGSDRRQQWVARRAFPRHAQPIEGVLNGVSLQNCSEEEPWTGTQILTTPLTAPRAASSSKQPRWRSVLSAR